jgi:hypothetical protein
MIYTRLKRKLQHDVVTDLLYEIPRKNTVCFPVYGLRLGLGAEDIFAAAPKTAAQRQRQRRSYLPQP